MVLCKKTNIFMRKKKNKQIEENNTEDAAIATEV